MTSSPHILVVEDDSEISELITRYLRDNDCRVSASPDARDADCQLESNRFDIVVLDLMLPGEDGLSLCRRLRGRSQLPVIMLTAKGEAIDRILGLEMGADDYMVKPFDPRELLARIRAILRRMGAAHLRWSVRASYLLWLARRYRETRTFGPERYSHYVDRCRI